MQDQIAHQIDDVHLKVQRAKKHLDELEKEVNQFCSKKPKPYSIVRYDDQQRQRHCIRCQLEDPPVTLAVIAGDVFHCLRSSLDYLIFALAKTTLSSYPKMTEFPILVSFDSKRQKSFDQQTKGVPSQALDIIDEFQPYHRRNGEPAEAHPLWRLNLACNIDKHRRLTVYGSSIRFKVPHDVLPLMEFENGNVMTLPLDLKQRIAVDPEITFDVLFGDMYEKLDISFSELVYIYDFVTKLLLPRFDGFFSR